MAPNTTSTTKVAEVAEKQCPTKTGIETPDLFSEAFLIT